MVCSLAVPHKLMSALMLAICQSTWLDCSAVTWKLQLALPAKLVSPAPVLFDAGGGFSVGGYQTAAGKVCPRHTLGSEELLAGRVH